MGRALCANPLHWSVFLCWVERPLSSHSASVLMDRALYERTHPPTSRIQSTSCHWEVHYRKKKQKSPASLFPAAAFGTFQNPRETRPTCISVTVISIGEKQVAVCLSVLLHCVIATHTFPVSTEIKCVNVKYLLFFPLSFTIRCLAAAAHCDTLVSPLITSRSSKQWIDFVLVLHMNAGERLKARLRPCLVRFASEAKCFLLLWIPFAFISKPRQLCVHSCLKAPLSHQCWNFTLIYRPLVAKQRWKGPGVFFVFFFFFIRLLQNQTPLSQRERFTQPPESRLFLVLNKMEDGFGWDGSTERPRHLLMHFIL